MLSAEYVMPGLHRDGQQTQPNIMSTENVSS